MLPRPGDRTTGTAGGPWREQGQPAVRLAGPGDTSAIGRLLHAFNTEFSEPAPPPAALAQRLGQLMAGGDTIVLLGGDGPDGPDGLAVLRFRRAIWTPGLESYLAELYVTPARRGQGLGRALMETALREARARGADSMDIGVDEPDLAARQLYESLGFSNRSGGDGPLMYVYERDLQGSNHHAAVNRTPFMIVKTCYHHSH